MSGPVLGFGVAQVAGVLFGLARERSWVSFGRPDRELIRPAFGYGGPLMLGSILNWFTQNASKIRLGEDERAGLPVMLWAMLAGTFICARQHFLNQDFLLQSVTRPIAAIALVEAVIAVALTVVVVPREGAVGGAMALAITSALSMLASFTLARRIGLIVPWRDIGAIVLAAAAMAIVILLLPTAQHPLMLLIKLVAGGATFAIVIAGIYRSALTKLWRGRALARG